MREEILVRLRSTDSASLARAQNAAPFGSIHSLSPGLGLHLIRAPGNSVAGLMRAFANHPDVLYAEPNYLVQTAVTNPDDSLLASLWGIEKIQAPLAWDTSTGGASAVVGVVDTGVDYNHPDLAANMWRAPTAFSVTIQGVPVICPAGSYGFNAINFSCDPRDDHNHGTHVSGTIGATGNNGLGVVGINWRAQMMGLKFMNASGNGTVSAAINAIEFAIQVKARFAGTATPVDVRVLSNSWTGGFSQSLLDQINKANANDMLFVAAAGNSGGNNDQTPAYPAAFSTAAPNVIAVAATDASDALASFSNYGPGSVQLGAPGVGIYSTLRGGGYANFSGTSMAAPHVAGAALLTLAACPSLRTPELKSAILANTDPLSGLSGLTTTGGRLNVNRLVRSCLPNSSLRATFLGVTGEDFVGTGSQSAPNGAGDWHLQLSGLRAVPVRVEVTSPVGGVWRAPHTTGSWIVAAQYSGDTGHLWFEPSSTPEFRVQVWYADGSTDAVNATNGASPGTLAATFLGVTGEDVVGIADQSTPNGMGDWHIQLSGLRAVPVRVEVTSPVGGVWRAPHTTGSWIIAAQYSGDTGHLWFEPSSTPEFRVQVWYADGSTDAVNVTNGASPGTLSAAFLGVTGEDLVGAADQATPNGTADWHIQLGGLRSVPVRLTVTSPVGGVWTAPHSGNSWIIAAQFSGDTGHLWFEPSSTPGFQVQVWYADGTTDAVNVTNSSGAAAFASRDLGATGED